MIKGNVSPTVTVEGPKTYQEARAKQDVWTVDVTFADDSMLTADCEYIGKIAETVIDLQDKMIHMCNGEWVSIKDVHIY